MFFYRKKGIGFVDRGDPSNYDFTQGTLVQGGVWTDLDLSAIVPAGAIAVIIRLVAFHSTAGKWAKFRKKGILNEYNIITYNTESGHLKFHYQMLVFCDSNRVIQYSFDSPAWTAITLTVSGWYI